MALINEHFLKLPDNDLFSDMAKRINSFKITHPKAKIIRLDVGDMTQPLPLAAREAMHKAIDEVGYNEALHGHRSKQGYSFLVDAILKNDYAGRGVHLESSEIFISDGTENEIENIGDILRHDNSIGVTDPTHPIYIDSNMMNGRAGMLEDGKWSNVLYIPCTEENGFVPELPDRRVDILYLCYPNDPTGMALSKKELKNWVNYALANDTLIMYDATYETYIQNPDIPHSIYEIKGAKKVAIEFRSFSKMAGFTGIHCGYCVVPKDLNGFTLEGQKVQLNKLWSSHHCTKVNGTSYITQRAAEAVYSHEGKEQIKQMVDYYMTNARIIKECVQQCGLQVYGGDDAPFLWVKAPKGLSSWSFFEKLLYEVNIVGVPGTGFGPSGEGYLRLTTLGSREVSLEAVERLKNRW